MQILLNCLLPVLYVALLAVVGLGSATGGDGIVVNAHDNHDHEDEAFIHLSEMLQAANPDAGLDIMAAGNLLHDLGEECLNASQLFAYLGVSEVITEDMFANASIVGSYFLRRANCVQLSSVSNAYAEIDSSEVCKSHIQSLLHDILSTTRVPVDETLECFSASDILHEDCVDHDEEITEAFANIFIKLLEGRCVAPPTAYFVDEVFELYATEDEDALHELDLNKLLTDLKIGRLSDAEDHDLEEDHDGHDHRRKRRDAEDEDHHEETKCYTVDEFLSMGKYETNDEGEKILTKAAFLTICPAMIHQIVSNSCVAEDHVDLPSDSTSTYTTAQKYGYGTISVFIISCLAFIGLLLFHSIGTHSFQIIMQFFIALGIGTLSGDALLHLIPEVVGLHGHSAEETDGGHEDHEEDQTHVWRLLVVVGGIYLFYLFENVLKLWNRVSGSNIHLHNHDNHGSTDSRINDGGERGMSIGGHHMTNLEVMQPTATPNGTQDSEA